MGYATRNNLWMDVEDGWRGWFKTPSSGADSSPEGWASDGVLLNGGGYSLSSWGSHKVYQFEWGPSSTLQESQMLQSLASGTYGRGLVQFHLPTHYDTNILPARWADPSMAVDDEGASMVYDFDPEGVATGGWERNMLPSRSAYYNLFRVDAGWRGNADSLYISIPEGYTLVIGAVYQSSGSGGIFAREVQQNGLEGNDVRLTEVAADAENLLVDSFSGLRAVRLWLGKTETGPSSVTATALIARLIKTSDIIVPADYVIDPDSGGYGVDGYGTTPYGGILSYTPEHFSAKYVQLLRGPWIGGMGHSGCRFVGKPTIQNNTGVNGGQVSFATTLKEVGSWISG